MRRILIGAGIAVLGLILAIAGAIGGTAIEPRTGLPVPAVNVPLVVIGIIGIIAGGVVIWMGILKRR